MRERPDAHGDLPTTGKMAGAEVLGAWTSSTKRNAALAARRVGLERLQALAADADALSGMLATRVAKKAERQAATAEEHAAVKAQRNVWGAVYGLLARIDDPRMTALLRAAKN